MKGLKYMPKMQERARGGLLGLAVGDSLLEDAISRSYYAVLHAAKAALLMNDTVAENPPPLNPLFTAI